MTTSFNWTITCLERYISTGLVKKVHWRLNAEQSGYKQYFIPFEDLTEEIIIGWLGSIQEFDKAEVEGELQTKLDQFLLSETTLGGMLPWKVETGIGTT
jgi:hypothetical protein